MSSLAARFAATVAALLLAAVAALLALGFLGLGLYLSLGELMPAREAAFATAVAALLLAATILLLGRAAAALAARRRRARSVGQGSIARRLAALLGDALGGEFSALAAAHPETTVAGSFLSGFAIGASPEMRRALRDLVVRK